jgi:hypothetical protein
MDKKDVEIGKMYSEWKQQQILNNAGCGTPVLAAIILFIVMVLSSCATKTKIEYVDREVVKYQKEVVHDTLLQHTHDSIYHTVFQKGDTIYDTKYVEKTRWRDRVVVKTDTCYKDSIQTVIKESVKEKQIIPKWCYFCLVVCAIFLIFAIRKLIRWLQTI